ncbi:MAG TPA: diguanylate cyclase [Acidimicrobiales bacterium]|nr:diguanylate cyclase [Acidimicrobiales bacterium]
MTTTRGSSPLLQGNALHAGSEDFSDAVVLLVLWYVEHAAGMTPSALLAAAGDDRKVRDLRGGGFSSYGQFRAVVERAAMAVGGTDALAALGSKLPLTADELVPYAELLHGMGSADGLLQELPSVSQMFLPALEIGVRRRGAGHWSVTTRLRGGLQPFTALCGLMQGMLQVLPRLFGHGDATVRERACSCRGAERCLFEVAWEEEHTPHHGEYLSLRHRAQMARMSELLTAVGRFVAGRDVDETLEQIVESARGATHAIGVVLALDPELAPARPYYASGLDVEKAEALAAAVQAPTDDGDTAPAMAGVVPVATATRRYGHLAVVRRGVNPPPGQDDVLRTYAELAAGTVETATQLSEARREVATAERLLRLSADLADAETAEDAAELVAAATSDLLDCDHVVVVVRHPDLPIGRMAGVEGFDPDVSRMLASTVVTIFDETKPAEPVFSTGGDDEAPVERCLFDLGAVACLSTPIVCDGELVGIVTASVDRDPERLRLDTGSRARFARLVAQAASGLRNAQVHEQVRHASLHDALTGLPNRTLLLDRMEHLLARARRNRTPAAVLFIDLDGFKAVNDSLGHASGDALLRAVAGRLRLTLRTSDSVGRLGGDEFCALIEGEAPDFQPERAAERVLQALRAPFEIGGEGTGTVRISASVGIAPVRPTSTVSDLLAEADAAAYAAKEGGRDRMVLFSRSAGRRLSSDASTSDPASPVTGS